MPTGGNAVFLPGVGFSFFSDLGNLFSWMASGISSIISFVKDAATNVWNLVVEIGGKIYHGVLNCVEKIVAAVKWVYDKIKTAIEDLIKFLEFLFQWKDFQRTKDVLYNFSELYMQREIKKIPAYKREFDSGIQQLVKTIEDWAKIGDMQLGDAGKTKITSKSKPASAQNAPGSLLTYHYQNNADKGETPALLTKADIKDTLIKVLFNVIEKQGEVFEKVINQFKALVIEAPRLSLQQILEKIVAIFSTAFLRGFQHLADALFDIIESVSQEMLDLLKRKVRIPVVSDILEYFGVSSLSALDLMCWITAIPATLLYKTIRNEAPFKAGSLTNALINAKSFEEIANAYKKPKAGTSPELLTNSVNAMYYSGHLITGTATLLLAVISPFEALDKTGSNETLSYTCIALGVVAASFNAVAGFISPRYPIENEVAAGFNIGLSSLCLLNKGLFSGVVQKKIGAIPKIKFFEVKNARGVGAAVDAVLALAGAGFTGYHFYELSSKPAGKERSQAILEESGNVASYLGRISYAATVNGASHSAPLITFFGVCTGGLHIATAIVEGE
jgi:hypothetical protein